MRSQLNLFPDLAPSPKGDLEVFEDDTAENMRFDPEHEKTLPENFQYHQDVYLLLESSASRLGDWAEAKTKTIAMELGAEVFQNVSCVGPADLVLKVDNKLFEIDVKIAERKLRKKYGWNPCWGQRRSAEIKDGVYGVCFVPAKSGMYCRWYTANNGHTLIHPPGLKDFWNPPLKFTYGAANQ